MSSILTDFIYLYFSSVRADDIINDHNYFGSVPHIIQLECILIFIIIRSSSAVAFISRSSHFDEKPPSNREARKVVYFERYSPVILRILMYGEVDKHNLIK